MKRFALFASFVSLCLLLGSAAFAQTYPAKPVRLIATYPPGGSSDLMARILAQKLTELWSQQVIVENKPGAAGSIGLEYAARQSADGYSFVIGNLGPVAVNPLLQKVPYDIAKDFIAVSMLCTGPNILVVNSASPVKSLQDLIELARAKPGQLNFGSGGSGSLAHLGGEMMKRAANVDIVHVAYKGGVLSVNDLLAGQVQMVFSDPLPVMQHIRAGKLRPIAITSAERSPLAPDIPTFAAQGLPEIVALNWWGVFLPAGTPKPIADKLNADLAKVLTSSDLKEQFAKLGVEPVASSPEKFVEFIKSETAKYAKLVREANIKGE